MYKTCNQFNVSTPQGVPPVPRSWKHDDEGKAAVCLTCMSIRMRLWT